MAGKGLSPCFAGCMVAGRMRRPGRIFAGPGAAPLRRLRRHLPLQGRLLRGQPPRKAPLQGELDAPEGADGGVHCRFAMEIPLKARQSLALCFVGDVRQPERVSPPRFAGGAAAGRAQQPGRVFAGQGAAPLRRLRRHLPLQGRLLGWRSPERLPCKGSWMRRKAQTEGCIAGWRRKYPLKPDRCLPRSAR